MSVSNTSTNATSTPPICSDAFLDSVAIKVVKTLAYSVVLLLSLVGNAFILAVLYRKRRLRTIINLFICNMSASDIVMELVVMPMRIKDVFLPQGQWLVTGALGSVLCKGASFVHTATLLVSIITLLIIAVERFFSVVYPLKRQPIRTRKVCFLLIAFTWFLSAVSAAPNLYTLKLTTHNNKPMCYHTWEPAFDSREGFKVELATSLVLFTILPFIILSSLYTAIIVALYSPNRSLSLASEERRRRAWENRRISLMLLAVVITFLLTWTPLNVYMYYAVFVTKVRPCELRKLLFAANFLSYTYPAINPLIYYVFNEHYKNGIQELLRCLLPCKIAKTTERRPTEVYNLRVTVASHLSLASEENQTNTAG